MLGMFKAMRTTLRHLPMKKITVQYPEERERLPERSRGLFRVVIDPAGGDPRCRACTLCETNCPVQVIRVNSTSKYALPAPDTARIADARIAAQEGVELKAMQPVLDEYYEHGTGLIAMLQDTQEVYGYLPRLALQEIGLRTGVSLSQIYGVSSFYNQFRLSPVGERIIDVCHGTACHVAGAVQITEALEEELGVADGKTTKDMKFTLSSVACMGACSQAPVMRIGDQTYGGLTPDKTRKMIRDLMTEVGAEKGDESYMTHEMHPHDADARNVSVTEGPEGGYRVKVCAGTACVFAGSMAVYDAFTQEVQDAGLADKVQVSIIGCHGLCSMSPVVVLSDDTLYGHLRPRDVSAVVEQHLKGGEPVAKFLYKDERTGERIRDWHDIGFYAQQTRIALRDVGVIDPESIDEYLARGGYDAARMALTEKTPEWMIENVTDSGIRGRGGAGFPTGVKWKFASQSKSDVKYLICNADEGDPGAFMDCSILEGDPHAVIEGMVIGSFAIGAHEGYVYVRAEYPLAVKRLTQAVADAEAHGFLGADCFGTGWEFNLHLKLGAGAFVCGEETALIASIEGRRGMPRTRPPYPAVSGLWGKPTNINNVETFSNVPWIIANGADAYAAMGVETSRGTKAFSLAGKIVNGGLVEVPMGSTLRHLIFDVGGGIKDGKAFKAVQLGGPSGGCVPASLLDTPVDYESLAKTGAIVGSGGMVVVDDETCMVDLARFFLDFTQKESCGKCVPCRLGTKRMLEILDRIKDGDGRDGDIELLEELSHYIVDGTLCALGGTAPNPVLTTIKYFREEYEAHVHEKRCPAGKCKALITYYIDPEACTGCTLCAKKCPTSCIAGEKKQPHVIDVAACIKCDTCRQVCKFDAVKVRSGIDQLAAQEA